MTQTRNFIGKTVYPESDGEPMADNTDQFERMMTIQGNLDAIYIDVSDVVVFGDLLWYPVAGDIKIRMAPDVMVVFGRPKGRRGSYVNEYENHVSPQVTFEIISPRNYGPELNRKREFYEKYGVEEHYEYDPERGKLQGWLRHGTQLLPIFPMQNWVSPRLKVRFGLNGKDLEMFRPDGQPFLSYVELDQQRQQTEQQLTIERRRADEERRRATDAEQRIEIERAALADLRAKLLARGIDPNTL